MRFSFFQSNKKEVIKTMVIDQDRVGGILNCIVSSGYQLIYHHKIFLKTDRAFRCVELKQNTVKFDFSFQAESTLATRQKMSFLLM